ncbi:MAG TPA: Ig-like domain-containing protein [Spirochaetota bacterium]|nr:Ig-like domain-containing protein [Spirochaetota bacterium]HPJ34761.1 Ig-like domain-containing protein [Spirochaetota bacterium]
MRRLLLVVVLSVITVAGCYDDEKFERPSVVSVTPGRGNSDVLPDALVTVVFSKSMDTVKTNEEFSLTCAGGRIDGYYSWDSTGRTLTFTPRSYLSMAEKYTIRITESAEDREGNDLKEFLSTFFTGGDLNRPRIVSYTPVANSIGNPGNSTVDIIFSEPVLLSSVYSGISVSPAVEGLFTRSPDGTVVTFTPRYSFSFGVTYSVNVSEGVQDEAGNSLLYPVTFSFTVGDDFTKPLLTAYQELSSPLVLDENRIISGAEKDRNIILDFSEEINTDDIESAVSISPSVPFYISSSIVAAGTLTFTRCIINFIENLESEETYTLRVSSVVTDMQENPLDHDYRFLFITDGAGSISPVVILIGDIQGDNTISGWPMGEIPVLGINATGLYDSIGIDFSLVINPLTFELKVETIAGQGGNLSVVNIDWPSSSVPQFTRIKFGLYQVETGSTYRLTVKGGKNGLKDADGNYMKEDFVQLIRF